MKLLDIIKEIEGEEGWEQVSPDFRVRKTGEDPETKSKEWDVDYTPGFTIGEDLDRLHNQLIDLRKKMHKEYGADERLGKYVEFFANFKKAFKAYMTRKYGR